MKEFQQGQDMNFLKPLSRPFQKVSNDPSIEIFRLNETLN